jgi:tetratricopeptide (TPR) repeat protein
LWLTLTFVATALAQQPPPQSAPSSNLTNEEIRRIIDERIQHYESLLGVVSTLFTITGVLLTIYMALQGFRDVRAWREDRRYSSVLDAKYNEIISMRDQIDNARIAERNYKIAEDYRKEERFTDAKRYYQEAIKYYPGDQDYYFNYGKVLIEMHDFGEALERYKSAVELFPQTTLFRQGLAECYEKTGQLDLALKAWHELLEVDHHNPFYYKRVANLYRSKAAYENAIEYFEKCNEISPDMDAIKGIINAAMDLYDRYTKERNLELANRYLQKLILTLENLHQINPAFFKLAFEEEVQRSPYFHALSGERLFAEAFSFLWHNERVVEPDTAGRN